MPAGPRLELTWPHKDEFLLVPKDDDGRPVWVPRDHPAAHEVRLTSPVDAVGAVDEADPYADDTVFVGDSLDALRVMVEVPEYAARYRGKVKLVYIDPPFNTGQTFAHYDDWMEHSVWLSFMRERLLLIRELLAPDGSVWVHLDDAEAHRMRCLLDEIFGAQNFVATVVWEKTDSPRMDTKTFSVRHDSVLVYAKSDALSLNHLPQTKSHANKTTDDGRRYYLNPLRARGGQGSTRAARPNLYYAMVAPDGTEVFPKLPSGEDGAWRWGQQKLADEADRVEWVQGKKGWNPYYRIYEDAEATVPPQTLWPFGEVGSTRNSAKEVKDLLGGTAFSTPKPERLLERVIHIASDPGDLVVDCFAGSGTTAAVAHKMGRRWATVELSATTVTDFVVPRLTKVVEGADPGGITEAVGWAGGGGFRVVKVEPSLYEVGPGGLVLLRDDISEADLARAMCGQLGYTHTPGHPVFAGRQGRNRLAVLGGVAGAEEVDELLGHLADGERITVAAAGFTPGTADRLAAASRGSQALKIPRDVLTRTRRAAPPPETPQTVAGPAGTATVDPTPPTRGDR